MTDERSVMDGNYPLSPLFKFLSLADGQTPPWRDRLTAFLDGKAYLSSPAAFNDPFDCLPPVDIPRTMNEFEERKSAFCARIQRAMPERSLQEISDTLSTSVEDMGLDALSDITRRSFSEGGARMGVFCLAECIQSVLMWSHYANNHQGIALRFDFKHHLDSALMPLFKVRYSEERAVIRAFFSGEEQAEAIMTALCTKADFWRYEQEWRFIEPDGAGTSINFDPRIVTAIVLGAKTPDQDAFWVIDECIKRGIPVMRAVPDTETFELSFNGVYDGTRT